MKAERPIGVAASSLRDPDRLTVRLSKATLHAAERGRRSLFMKLTAANAERIAELSRQRPNFVENDPTAPTMLLLDDELRDTLPREFFEGPSEWLESQPNILRHDRTEEENTAHTIFDLWDKGYDMTRVKEFSVRTRQGDRAVVSKRLSRATIGLKEAAIHRKAYEAGIPTVKIYGEIFDKGNAYLLMEKFSGINLDAFVYWINERNKRANALFEAVINDWKEHGEPVDLGPYGFLDDSGSVKRLFAEFLECSEQRDALSVLSDLHGKLVHPSLHGPIDLTSIPRPRYLTRLLNEYWRVDSIEAFARLDARQMMAGIQSARASVIRPLRRVQGKLVSACYEAIFGSPAVSVSGLEQEAQRLNALCVERGIIHTDLYARNILVEWDFSRNEPVYAPGGSLTFKLIDWEPVKQMI